MRVHSYTILHYGRDYLPYALRSVYHSVDHLHVIYTPHPSHGHNVDVACPESRESLLQAALSYDPDDKIDWYDTRGLVTEGPQRDMAVNICQRAGAEMILVVDCDEVWPQRVLEQALEFAQREDKARNWLINFTHFWRSFDYVCIDNNWPVRIIDLRHKDGTGYIPADFGEIYHFGYAVRDEIMRYKWQIHGHKDEIRPGWWEKWEAWPPADDCHPTNGDNWWMPEPFDKRALPEFMREHQFYNVGRIE